MQACSSADGRLYGWTAPNRDWSGAFFPGPGSAQDVVLAVINRGSAGAQSIQLTGIASSEAIGAPSVGLAPAFPGTVTPAVWFDGSMPAFADSGATIPAVAPSGIVQRIDERSPLTGSWTAGNAAWRPVRDAYGCRFEPLGSAGLNLLTRPDVAGIPSNACTLVVSMVARDGFAGPASGVFEDTFHSAGIACYGGQIYIYYNGGFWNSGLVAPIALHTTIAVRYTPTGVDVKVNAAGTITTASLAATIPSTNVVGPWQLGYTPQGAGPAYSSFTQAMAVARAVTDSERDALMAFAHAKLAPVAYPNDRALIAILGHSIPRGVDATTGGSYPFRAMGSVRAAGHPCEVMNVAVGGTGAVYVRDVEYPLVSAQYSASRVRNVLVIDIGCNDLANGNDPTTLVLGPIYTAADTARAAGWRVVLTTILPRSDTMAVSQSAYNAARAFTNTDLAANWHLHADAFADTRGVTHLGADGDSNDTTYFGADKIHPVNAGHALLEPVFTTAILSVL